MYKIRSSSHLCTGSIECTQYLRRTEACKGIYLSYCGAKTLCSLLACASCMSLSVSTIEVLVPYLREKHEVNAA